MSRRSGRAVAEPVPAARPGIRAPGWALACGMLGGARRAGARRDHRVPLLPVLTAPLLLSVFPTFAVGGAQIRFATIANHFGREWRHAIVAMDGVTRRRERLDPGST